MNKPIREPCEDCKNNRYCGLERRGICTDFKKKDKQVKKPVQPVKHKHS